MKREKYLGMRPGDLDGKPYARYWNPEMRPLPAHVSEERRLAACEKCKIEFISVAILEQHVSQLHPKGSVPESKTNEHGGESGKPPERYIPTFISLGQKFE
mgnify:CR=1 FL=1